MPRSMWMSRARRQLSKILRGLRTSLRGSSRHYLYLDEALEQAVRLGERYVTERTPFDKAVDLIDEAGSQNQGGYVFYARQSEKSALMIWPPEEERSG